MFSIFRVFFTRRMLVAGVMGFSCGLPLLLTLTVLQAWMTEEGVDLGVIGLMTLVGLPYMLKFVWSPFMDWYTLPFLGRRRGWLLVAQVSLAVAITGLGMTNPTANPWLVAFVALLVAFFSASQDILVDAYRREDLADEELGLGSSFYVNGYRIGMLLASGGGLILADQVSFRTVYLIMACCMSVGIAATLLTPEPNAPKVKAKKITQAVLTPFAEFFSRSGALWILAFVLLYKVGDQMAGALATPFYLAMGFTKTEIGTIANLFGSCATIIGLFIGGLAWGLLGINRSLWVFGILQAVSTACFALLAHIGNSIPALAGVIAFENLSSGMGTAAYLAFMAAMTDKRFTATQFALLTSIMGVPRVLISAPSGFLAEHLGWAQFFLFCTAIAIPGLLLLLKFAPWTTKNGEFSRAQAEQRA